MLLFVGFVIAVLVGLWLAVQVSDEEGLSAGGALVGAGLAFIPVALFMGFGLYFYVQAGQDQETQSTMRQQRELLDILRSRGQVRVEDMAIELGVNLDQVHDIIHQLVGLQVFSGYVNWKDGILYSEEASNLRTLEQCRRCGGDIELAGKGVIVCPFCGTEYFLT